MGFYTSDSAEARSYGAVDLSSIMRQVYVWMAIGLGVCFGVSWFFVQQYASAINVFNQTGTLPNSILFSPVFTIGTLIAYFILAFAVQPVIMRSAIPVGTAIYLVFAAVFGALIAPVILQYVVVPNVASSASTAAVSYDFTPVTTAFAATAAMFAAMSIWGYTTKADLSKFGNILMMAIIGLIIASVVNIFARSEMIYWLISYAGVIIFAGFTAYDTNWIKNTAMQVANSGDPLMAQRVALLGAFHLFYDFVQLFLFLLRILGGSRRD